jgi:hypothetical protein
MDVFKCKLKKVMCHLSQACIIWAIRSSRFGNVRCEIGLLLCMLIIQAKVDTDALTSVRMKPVKSFVFFLQVMGLL